MTSDEHEHDGGRPDARELLDEPFLEQTSREGGAVLAMTLGGVRSTE